MVTEEQFQKHLDESAISWGGSYVVMRRLIQEKNLRIGAEIGVGYGGNAENMLGIPTLEKLYGIDPFRHFEEADSVMNIPQEDFDDIHRMVQEKLAPFKDRFTLIREISVNASKKVPDELDFVYIDGDHSYEGVFADLCAWFRKVRLGGIIAGHDYNHPQLPGVTRAINEFFHRLGWQIHTEDNHVWWVEKKPINISFFIPTYNYGKSIREAVESIVRDNFEPGDELIIYNDGSSDDTAHHLAELQKEYPVIKVLMHARNKGPSATRNDAVETCRNPLVFSHDHDNILVPGSVAKLKEFLLTRGADIASFGALHYFSGSTDNVMNVWTFEEEASTLRKVMRGAPFPGASGNYLFTKESWVRAGGYPDSWLDSWGFGIRQLVTGSRMLAMPDSFYWHQYKHQHGYESTYVKGVRTGRISSLVALQILIPHLNLFHQKGVNYMMGPRGRYHWMKRLTAHPVPVRFNTHAEYETSLHAPASAAFPIRVLQKIKNRIKAHRFTRAGYRTIRKYLKY